MRHANRLLCVMVIISLSGCASFVPRRAAPPAPTPHKRTFAFVVQSDPSGAEVYQKTAGGEVHLGKTPLTLPMEFLLRRDGNAPLNFLEPRAWHPVASKGPLAVSRYGKAGIRIELPEIELRMKGYTPELFTYTWSFPSNLKQRVGRWESSPLPTRHEKTVIFKNPTSPECFLNVTIACEMAGAKIHAINAQGGLGELVGTTPLSAKIGFGRLRAATGQFLDWKRWTGPNAEIFTHNREGELFLQCILVHEGYEPVVLQNRRMTKITAAPEQAFTAKFQMTKPVKPEAEFKLSFDSLPSGAAVYEVREDGALGSKVGQTPFAMNIGIAQESTEGTPGTYLHKDWKLWGVGDLIRWEIGRNGALQAYLNCALYKEGMAVENVMLPIFLLEPGKAFPSAATLTIPLLTAEQSAARESRIVRQGARGPTVSFPDYGANPATGSPREEPKEAFVWKAPTEEKEQGAGTADAKAPPKKPKPRWWKRIF